MRMIDEILHHLETVFVVDHGIPMGILRWCRRTCIIRRGYVPLS